MDTPSLSGIEWVNVDFFPFWAIIIAITIKDRPNKKVNTKKNSIKYNNVKYKID